MLQRLCYAMNSSNPSVSTEKKSRNYAANTAIFCLLYWSVSSTNTYNRHANACLRFPRSLVDVKVIEIASYDSVRALCDELHQANAFS